jgi:hypothetical protein
MTPPLIAVFGCTVFTQGLINPDGPAGSCLAAARAGQIRLVVTEHVIREIRELPPKLPSHLGITAERILAFLLDLAKYAEPVESVAVVFT